MKIHKSYPKTLKIVVAPPIGRIGSDKRRCFSLLLLLFPFLAYSQNYDPQQQGQAQLEQIEQARKQLAEEITAIAENENRQAGDYRSIAETIVTIGETSTQQGQAIPVPTVFDGLHAVDLGEELNPLETDWENLRERLEALLDQPPPQEEDQNQDGESEDQENQDEQSGSDQQSKDGKENQDSEDQSDESGENQQTPEQDESQQGDQSDQQGEEGAKNDSSEEDGHQQKDPTKSPNKEHGGVGDLENSPEQPELDQQQPPQPPQPQQAPMQQVGGVKEQGEQTARQAMAQQLMDQLKQQDDPGKLFMLMQQAEDGTPITVPKNRKDW